MDLYKFSQITAKGELLIVNIKGSQKSIRKDMLRIYLMPLYSFSMKLVQ